MPQLKTYIIEIEREHTSLKILAFECEDKADAYDKMIGEWSSLAFSINKGQIVEYKGS